jgi:hypothetical protein
MFHDAYESGTTRSGDCLALASDPRDSLFSVTGAAIDPLDPNSTVTTAVGVLFYSIWGTNDLVAAANGMPYDNQSTVYYSPLVDNAALNAGVERVQADPRAQSHMRRHYQLTGPWRRWSRCTTPRPAKPFQHEVISQRLVRRPQ